MAIRKEQVLALLALLTVAYCGKGYLETPVFATRYSPTKAKYEPVAVAAVPLVAGDAPAPARAGFFTEPSETQALPPRALDFPPRAPLSVAGLPLEIGPDYAHLWMVRVPGAPLENVTITQGGDTTAPAPAAAAAAAEDTPQDRAAIEEQLARTYDRIWYGGLRSPQFGIIEPENHDLFALEESGEFDGVKLKLRQFSVKDRKVAPNLQTYGGTDAGAKIDKIRLADTLRNQIQRRTRHAKNFDLDKRRELIDWLLEQAKQDTTVYDEAMRQAEAAKDMAASDPEIVRLKLRVLRARGDVAGEVDLLQKLIQQGGTDASFGHEGLGIIKARLCLWLEAEADLRKAVQLKPTDARPHGALAEFLRLRGRSTEALESARRAAQTMGSVPAAADRARVARVIVACHLAVGDVDGARAALQQHGGKTEDNAYLIGCIEYTAGKIAQALAAFRQAAGGADGGHALLGQAACLVREGNCQEAHDLFLRVVDQEPMLRHRAATGLALLFLRIGQYESANQWLDRALEADPQDPYAFYLRGRTLRLTGQLAAAAEAIATSLQRRDDFVHALAEMGAVQANRALETRGEDQAKAVFAARRYIDRAVALVPPPLASAVELFELQGLASFVTAQPKEAEAAFSKARDLAVDENAKWYGNGALAVVAYSRGQLDDATLALKRMQDDLAKDHPLAKWASATVTAIEDHAMKETLVDTFERLEPGAIWKSDADGALREQIKGGRLVLDNKFTRGNIEVNRENATKNGKSFLAVSATMQLGPGHSHEGFAGLGIELTGARGGAGEFKVHVGIREGVPYLFLQDGRAQNGEDNPDVKLTVEGFDRSARQTLELRVVPLGDEQSRQLTLLVSWNGVVVHRRDLKTLSTNTNAQLRTILFARTTGKKGTQCDVAFDDYRLERRKEVK